LVVVIVSAGAEIDDLAENGAKAKFLLRDRDTKFTAAFDSVFEAKGVTSVQNPLSRPLMQTPSPSDGCAPRRKAALTGC